MSPAKPQTVRTFLRFPSFPDQGLMLENAPTYLRFVVCGSFSNPVWDALDELDDAPNPGEAVIAAKFDRFLVVHFSAGSISTWHRSAMYSPVHPQPSNKILKSRKLWDQWVDSMPSEEIQEHAG